MHVRSGEDADDQEAGDAMTRTRRCPALRKDGTPCEAFAAAGRDTCAAHDAASLARRRPNHSPRTRQRMVDRRERVITMLARLPERERRLREELTQLDDRLRASA